MNLTKQLINLIGALVVVVIVVAGVVLIAVPMFSQAQMIDGQTRTVAQSNSIYEAQVAQLTTAQESIDDVDAELADLRTEITAQPTLDDVLELVDAAVVRTGATIESITAADPEPWAARAAVVDAAGTGVPVAAASEEATSGTDESATGGAVSEDAAASEADAPTAQPAPDASAVAGQTQVLVTINVTITDAKTAADFVDALRIGPRLLLPINSTFDNGTLTVQALAFIRTEDSE